MESLASRMCCRTGFAHWLGLIVDGLIAGAQVQDQVRCAFDGDHIPAGQFVISKWRNILGVGLPDIMDGDHAFAFRIERDLIHAWIGLVQFDVVSIRLGCRDQQ